MFEINEKGEYVDVIFTDKQQADEPCEPTIEERVTALESAVLDMIEGDMDV